MPAIALPELDLTSKTESVTPGDALISANVILRGGLFSERINQDAAKFLDLCSLIEMSVLYDRLVCLPTGTPVGFDSLRLVEALKREGILWQMNIEDGEILERAAFSVLDFLPEISLGDARKLLKGMTTTRRDQFRNRAVTDAFHEMRIQEFCLDAYRCIDVEIETLDSEDLLYRFMRTISYLSLASFLDVSYVPNFDRLAIVTPIMKRSIGHIHESFIERANLKISEYVQAQQDRLRLAGRELDIPLPPIASIVLARARERNDLVGAVLATRDEFAMVRERFAKYAAIVASDQVSIEESLHALDTLETDLRTVAQAAEQPNDWRLLEWRPLATFVASAIDDPLELSSTKSWIDLSISLLKMPAEMMMRYIRQRRVQPIIGVPGQVNKIESYSRLTSDLFQWEPSPLELRRIKTYSQLAKRRPIAS